MAFTVIFTDPATGHPRFNIDQTLNFGSQGADVELLQVLLNMLYFDLQPGSGRLGFVPPTEQLKEDGIFGLETQKLGRHFFATVQKRAGLFDPGKNPEATGIDPMRAPNELSHRLKVRYIIDALNISCSSVSAQSGNTRYQKLASDTGIPVRLRNALRVRKKTADKYRFGG